MKKNIIPGTIARLSSLMSVFFLIASCSENFLDQKPDKSIIVPTTYADLQSLLDNNVDAFNNDPALGCIGADDFEVLESNWPYLTETERNSYSWNQQIFEGNSSSDWSVTYRQVFYANVVLEQLTKLNPTSAELSTWNTLKGSALFYRAIAYFNLLQHFAPPYQEAHAPGLPLRLTADINEPVSRASLQACYAQVLADLEESLGLLPSKPAFKTRPSREAAFGLLARYYLITGDYHSAKIAADSCLNIQSALLDYNELNPAQARPVAPFNAEVIYHSMLLSYGIIRTAFITPALYAQYDAHDLRKVIFANTSSGYPVFKGTYSGTSRMFSGITTAEVYLTRAECYARLGEYEHALEDLNLLLQHRYVHGNFTPLTATTSEETLTLVLRERRKELLFRNVRWSDLRRLNDDPNLAITLTRTISGETYTLPPGDLRYTYPIPDDEIMLSGIEQNPR